jgi:hypothetical protein
MLAQVVGHDLYQLREGGAVLQATKRKAARVGDSGNTLVGLSGP